MVSAVSTGILSSVSAYSINFLMTSRSFVPVSSNEYSIPRSLEFKVTIRKTSSLFVDHNLSPYNNKRWLGIGALHGDFGVSGLLLYAIPWIFWHREKKPGNPEDFLKNPGLWRIPQS
jgi:hypothetical protein